MDDHIEQHYQMLQFDYGKIYRPKLTEKFSIILGAGIGAAILLKDAKSDSIEYNSWLIPYIYPLVGVEYKFLECFSFSAETTLIWGDYQPRRR